MEPITRISHILQTIETFPKVFVDAFHEEFGLEQLLGSIQDFIKSRFYDSEICLELFSQAQFRDLLTCIVHDNDNLSIEDCHEQFHRLIRCPVPDSCGECFLEKLCQGRKEGEYRRMRTLKHLQEQNLFHKNDVMEMQLLRKSFHGSESIFHYLVEWNPTALKTLNKYKMTLLQELIEYRYPIEKIKLAFKAGLKYLPNELGLLLFTEVGNVSPYTLLMNEDTLFQFGKEGLTIIDECFHEVEHFKLQATDPTPNLNPFMVAAWSPSPCLDLMYYLLRKDPSVLLQSEHDSFSEERRFEGNLDEVCIDDIFTCDGLIGFRLAPDPTTNPFLLAVCDQSCPSLDLVYNLLRKDPSKLLQFNPCYTKEREFEEGTRRKRRKISGCVQASTCVIDLT